MSTAIRFKPLLRRHRSLALLLSLVLLTLTLRLLWGWHADRQVRALLDEYRRQGQPVTARELKFTPVPDADNAWLVQTSAFKAVVPGTNSPRTSNIEYKSYPPYPAAWMTLAAGSEKAHGPVFSQLRQARQLHGVQIHQGLRSPLAAVPLTYLNTVRHTANLTCDGAMFVHLQGNDAEAIERVHDVFHLSRSLNHDPFMISQLVAFGCHALACDAAMTIAPGLRFDDATRKSTQSLIQRLLDERWAQQGMRSANDVERLLQIDTAQQESQNQWLIRPLADREIVRNRANFDLIAQACAAPTWPQAQALLSRTSWEGASGNLVFPTAQQRFPRYSRWYGDHFVNMSAAVERHFRRLAERRMLAVSLACQMYKADHRRFPQRLDQLVPNYLPAVPLDPFHDDGRTIGFIVLKHKKAELGDRPVIYFDPGDPTHPVPDEPTYGWYVIQRFPGPNSSQVRQYRDLTRFTP